MSIYNNDLSTVAVWLYPFPGTCALFRAGTSWCHAGWDISPATECIEGIAKSKISVIEHLLQSHHITSHQVTVLLLQETHSKEASNLKIPGFVLAAYTKSGVHGIASFVRHSIQWRKLATSAPESSLEWAATEAEGVTIVNVYKPLLFGSNPTRFQSLPIHVFMPVISIAAAQPGAN